MAQFDPQTGERLDPEGEEPKAPKKADKPAEPKTKDAVEGAEPKK